MSRPLAKIRTCLCLDRAEEAAAFYVSLLPNSLIESRFSPIDGKPPLVVDLTLAGAPYQILSRDAMPPSEAFPPLNFSTSLSVTTENQAETDDLWAKLTAHGGTESRCGWLKDRFGLAWQIVPRILPERLSSPDRAAAGRAMQAMMGMTKIDITAIEKAYQGE